VDAAKLRALRARMQRFVDEGVVSGAVTVIGWRGRTIHEEAVGLADLERGTPMRTDTLFRIASMTKPITALALLMLVDEQRLSVDDPVERYLPEFRGQPVVRAGTGGQPVLATPERPMTVKHLLTHSSGLPAMPPPGFEALYQTRNRSLADAVAAYARRPLEFDPGTRFRYGNTGIDTAGRLVEVISGRPFEAFCAERIFRPLGLTDTAFFVDAAKAPRLARLYDRQDGALRPVPSRFGGEAGGPFPLPAAGAFSTGGDLARLYTPLAAPADRGARRLLSPATMHLFVRNHAERLPGLEPGMGFGLGVHVVTRPQGVTHALTRGTFGHGGAFGTQGWIDPGRQLFFILLVQRLGLPGGDASELRAELHRLGSEAIGRAT
jgi:CubicO group peptidase (beta-lactamase class C family)